MGTEELIKLDEGQFLEFKENCYWLEDKELEKKELLKKSIQAWISYRYERYDS